MGWLETVLLSIVALWLIVTVIWLCRRRGKGCCGNCEGCQKMCKR